GRRKNMLGPIRVVLGMCVVVGDGRFRRPRAHIDRAAVAAALIRESKFFEDGLGSIGAAGRARNTDGVAVRVQPRDITGECRLLPGEQLLRAKVALRQALDKSCHPLIVSPTRRDASETPPAPARVWS